MMKQKIIAVVIFAAFVALLLALALGISGALTLGSFLVIFLLLAVEVGMFFSTTLCCRWVQYWMLETVDATKEEVNKYFHSVNGKHKPRKLYRWMLRRAPDQREFNRRYRIGQAAIAPGPVCGILVPMLLANPSRNFLAYVLVAFLAAYCIAMAVIGRAFQKGKA